MSSLFHISLFVRAWGKPSKALRGEIGSLAHPWKPWMSENPQQGHGKIRQEIVWVSPRLCGWVRDLALGVLACPVTLDRTWTVYAAWLLVGYWGESCKTQPCKEKLGFTQCSFGFVEPKGLLASLFRLPFMSGTRLLASLHPQILQWCMAPGYLLWFI